MGKIAPKPDATGPRLQFGIRSLLVATTVLAIVLGVLKWAGAPPGAIAAIGLLIGVEFVVAVLLVLSVAKPPQPPDDADRDR